MTQRTPGGFCARQWRGEVPMPLLLRRDMLGVGTLVNLACSLLALVMAARGVPVGVAATVYFTPLPYNAFLFAAVWNSPQRTMIAGAWAALWMVMMMFV